MTATASHVLLVEDDETLGGLLSVAPAGARIPRNGRFDR